MLSDAAHNLSDAVTVVLALWARWQGRRPPTLRYTYGFKRAEVLAALANAVTLIAITVLIAREAWCAWSTQSRSRKVSCSRSRWWRSPPTSVRSCS